MSMRSGIGSALAAASVIVTCMLASPIPGHLARLVVPTLIAGASVLTMLAVPVVRRACRHARLHRELLQRARTATLGGIEIEELAGIEGVFVAGLVRPHIFCAQGLDVDLDPDEMQAVLLHERHHQLDRAPAQLVALDAMAPVVAALHVGHVWLTRKIAGLEIAADRYALAHGASRGALARALLKLQPMGSASPIGIGFATAADLRLQALLEDTREGSIGPSVWLVGPVAAAAVCLAFIGLA